MKQKITKYNLWHIMRRSSGRILHKKNLRILLCRVFCFSKLLKFLKNKLAFCNNTTTRYTALIIIRILFRNLLLQQNFSRILVSSVELCLITYTYYMLIKILLRILFLHQNFTKILFSSAEFSFTLTDVSSLKSKFYLEFCILSRVLPEF